MKHKRRIVLYSLAALLLVGAIAYPVLFQSALERKRRFDEIDWDLRNKEATIEYHSTDFTYPSWLRWVFGNTAAAELFGYRTFRAVEINLFQHRTAQVWAQDPGPPPKPTKVSIALLEHLSTLHRLERLHLNGIIFPTNDFSLLKGLTELKDLSLRGTNTTDSALQIIGTFTHLETIDLENTDITDQGLDDLATLSSLKHLFLQETEVTTLGVTELQKSLPNCEITVTFINGSARYRDKVHLAEILTKECLHKHDTLFGRLHSLRLTDSLIIESHDDRFTVVGQVAVIYDDVGFLTESGPYDFMAIMKREGSHWHLARLKGTVRNIGDRYKTPYDLILRE